VPRIDWTPFFQTWELAGHYPEILRDPTVGEAARTLWADAQEMLDRIVRERWLRARAVVGFFEANSNGCEDIITEKATLFRLLGATERVGISLTESFAMSPASAVCGTYFWRPEARYFGVGKIERDQVESYAQRKGMTVEDVERWLAPNLAYDRPVARRGDTAR
jgi:cobalamin-dependent methionine synthase I